MSEDDDYRVPVSDADRTKAAVAMNLVAAATGVSTAQMLRPQRLTPKATRARWVAIYLAHVSFAWTLERAAHVFGVNRATAGIACRWVEEARDQSVFDGVLDGMERCIQALYALPRLEVRP
jgi:hypothetical protein